MAKPADRAPKPAARPKAKPVGPAKPATASARTYEPPATTSAHRRLP